MGCSVFASGNYIYGLVSLSIKTATDISVPLKDKRAGLSQGSSPRLASWDIQERCFWQSVQKIRRLYIINCRWESTNPQFDGRSVPDDCA